MGPPPPGASRDAVAFDDAAYARQVAVQLNGGGGGGGGGGSSLPVAVCAPSSYTDDGGTHASLPTATPIMVQQPGMPGMVAAGQRGGNVMMQQGNNQMPRAYPMPQHGGSHQHAYASQGGQVLHVVAVPELTPQERRLLPTMVMSRWVKIFACIDIFFGVLRALKYPTLILIVAMPMCGYYGAQWYEPKLTRVYMVFQALSAGLSIYDCTQNFGGGELFFNLLSIAIAMYIIRLLMMFHALVANLDADDLGFVRQATLQRQRGVFY